jgi:hypothetical protein
MACEGFPANSFRASVFSGGERPSPVVASKTARRNETHDGLGAVGVARTEGRRGNHRGADRLPLGRTAAKVRKGRSTHDVSLVNLSGGGAMIEADLQARLWDKLTLILGDHGEIECAVRWLRDNRFGLEFAHETRIDCDLVTRDETLREVIRNNFPQDHAAQEAEPTETPLEAPGPEPRAETRHPLIWSGLVRHGDENALVRIRNISATGAMIQSLATLAPGNEVVLDLGEAGTHSAQVCWSHGDQAGIAFAETFDIRLLAACRPEVAERRWAKPDYLRDENVESSPWASQWARLTVKDLSRNLCG